MSTSPILASQGNNYCSAELGSLQELSQYGSGLPGVPGSVEGKVFLKALLGLTSTEISINNMPQGQSLPFHHKHQINEEIYIFIAGQGEFQVDGNVFPVGEGSVIRVSPEGERSWRNTGSKDLIYIVVQARAGSYGGQALMDRVPLVRQW